MRLDLVENDNYRRHYEWLQPPRVRRVTDAGAASYQQIWALATLVNPRSFSDIRESVIPALTNGNRTNPSRRETLAMLRRVRANQIDENNPIEVSVATMLATRPQRWEELAAIVGDAVPTEFRLYRWTRGMPFCINAARQLIHAKGQAQELRLQHDEMFSWALTRDGAMQFRGEGASVLHVANIPFGQTVADILVDNATFRKPHHAEAEVLVAAPANTLVTLANEAEIHLDGRIYQQANWRALSQVLQRKGIRF